MGNKILDLKKIKKDRLLSLLALDVNYTHGEGDWLYYEDQFGKEVAVLDVVGSYGVNLLGHKNQVHDKFVKKLPSFPPNFIQVSSIPLRDELSAKLIQHMELHSGVSNWNVEYANTGSEIVDTALKLAYLDYNKKSQNRIQETNLAINRAKKISQDIALIRLLEDQRLSLLNDGWVLSLEGGFHGKSFTTFTLHGGSALGKQFPTAFKHKKCSKAPEKFAQTIDQLKRTYFRWNERNNNLEEKEYLPVVAIFIEPIQGESGVYQLSEQLLRKIQSAQKENNCIIISDEVQCGLYRTGKMSALSIDLLIPDIYCFGKPLGGGIAKIAALLCQETCYHEDFHLYHSSTFGEDYLSSWVAIEVLSQIELSAPELVKVSENRLYAELEQFGNKHNHLIKEVRGFGHMVGLEFKEATINTNYFTKFLKDLGLLGYWVSSVLLYRENIRILPTLSNSLTFRIQPSIYFTRQDFDELLIGLANFNKAVLNNDMKYLFGHILEIPPNMSCRSLPEPLRTENFPQNAAVFLCHPIDYNHLIKSIDLLKCIEESKLEEILEELASNQKFSMYHLDSLVDANGEHIDIVLMGIPLTSGAFYQSLRNGSRRRLIQQIQEAVDFANDHDAKSIGLGQFTSIITKNGEYLHSEKAVLTTGNAFTAGLVLKSIQVIYNQRAQQLRNISVTLVGAAGNIVSTLALMLVDKVAKMHLVYRSDIRQSRRARLQFLDFLKQCLEVPEMNSYKLKLPELNKKNTVEVDIEKILKGVEDWLTVSTSLEQARHTDLIIIGTNDTRTLLSSENVMAGSVIIDVAVPPNVSQSVVERSDITYLKGGVASLPIIDGQEQLLNSCIIPFEKGASYACLSETFGLAFEGYNREHCIGDLTMSRVEEITSLMESHGFGLKRWKTESSW